MLREDARVRRAMDADKDEGDGDDDKHGDGKRGDGKRGDGKRGDGKRDDHDDDAPRRCPGRRAGDGPVESARGAACVHWGAGHSAQGTHSTPCAHWGAGHSTQGTHSTPSAHLGAGRSTASGCRRATAGSAFASCASPAATKARVIAVVGGARDVPAVPSLEDDHGKAVHQVDSPIRLTLG